MLSLGGWHRIRRRWLDCKRLIFCPRVLSLHNLDVSLFSDRGASSLWRFLLLLPDGSLLDISDVIDGDLDCLDLLTELILVLFAFCWVTLHSLDRELFVCWGLLMFGVILDGYRLKSSRRTIRSSLYLGETSHDLLRLQTILTLIDDVRLRWILTYSMTATVNIQLLWVLIRMLGRGFSNFTLIIFCLIRFRDRTQVQLESPWVFLWTPICGSVMADWILHDLEAMTATVIWAAPSCLGTALLTGKEGTLVKFDGKRWHLTLHMAI